MITNLSDARLWEAGPSAALNTLKPPADVPEPPPNFIGREEELAHLIEMVQSGRDVINIHGTIGAGKTAVARALVQRIKAGYPDGHVEVKLQGAEGRQAVTPAQALTYVLQKFDPSLGQLPADEQLLIGRYRSLLGDKKAILLLDNARDYAQIEAFLPPPGECLVLTTSWDRMDSPDGSVFNRRLGKLAQKDALNLLGLLTQRAGAQALDLVERCDRLPQAIAQVASWLNNNLDLSVDDLLILLQVTEERLAITGVNTLIQVNYMNLSEPQRRDWRALAVFLGDFDAQRAAWVWGRIRPETPPASIPLLAVQAKRDLADFLGAGLVEQETKNDRFSLLRLEKDFITGQPEFQVEVETARLGHARAFLRLLEQVNERFLQGDKGMLEALALFDSESLEIRAAWEWILQGPPEDRERLELRHHFPGAFANLMAVRLLPNERIAWLEAGKAAARPAGDRPLEILLATSLGLAYYVMDNTRDGLACQLEALPVALALARETGDCRGLARVLGNLGLIYRATNHTLRARRYFEKQLVLARRAGDRNEEGWALGNLGRAYHRPGRRGRRAAAL